MKKETYDDAYFASLTTQQLEEMIDLGLELPSQENRKALLRILEVLEERENDAIVQKAWEEFQLYYNSPERKGKERYYFDEAALEEEEARERERQKKQEKQSSRKVSISRVCAVGRVALLTIILTFGTMAAAQAVGINVFGILGEWTDNAFRFNLGTPPSSRTLSEKEAYVETFRSRLEEIGIPADLVPTWYPEGFVPDMDRFYTDIVEDGFDSVGCGVDNETEDKHYTIAIDRYYDRELLNNLVVEKNDKDEVEEYTVNGRRFYIMLNNPGYTGTWSDGELFIVIGGDLSKEEVKEIINSIGGY